MTLGQKAAVGLFFAFLANDCFGQMLAPAGVRRGAPGIPAMRTYSSANGKVELTLEDSYPARGRVNPVNVAATVRNSGGGGPWNVKFTKQLSIQFLLESDVFVPDDGDFFVVVSDNGAAVNVFKRDGTQLDIRYGRDIRKSFFRSNEELFFEVDKVEGERVIRCWDRDENKWRAYRVSNGTEMPNTARYEADWSGQLRKKILAKLQRGKKEMTRRKLGHLPAPLARIAESVVPPIQFGEIRECDYEFLTLLKNPVDRVWIEMLIGPRDEGARTDSQRFRGWFVPPSSTPVNYCEVTDPERRVGDWLLGVWDGKVAKSYYGKDRARDWNERFDLGRVQGRIHLCALFTPHDSKSGAFHIRLLPAGMANPERSPQREESVFYGAYVGRPPFDPVTEINFAFTTVLPGRYQMKVLWDKRKPHFIEGRVKPGDYESALLEPFEVKAGGIISELEIYCTNRIAGAETYYAVDELEMKLRVKRE